MKGLVIYKGKYGATRQYAMWIGHELQLTVASADRFPKQQLRDYDYFIIGSSVYIGTLEIQKWLKKNLGVLCEKKLFLFQVAATPVAEKAKRESYNKTSIPYEIVNKVESYFFPGRMIMRNLSAFDRFKLKMGAWLTKDPIEKRNMLTDFDHVKKEHVMPLVEAVRKHIKIAEPEMVA